jgi:hypothetical protein
VSNPIVAENGKPGTLSWLPQRLSFTPMTKHGVNLGTYGSNYLGSGRSAAIEGWCSHTTAKAGDSLQVFVSTNPAGDFTLDLYRWATTSVTARDTS